MTGYNADCRIRKSRTRDMGGNATTHEFTRAILDHMELSG